MVAPLEMELALEKKARMSGGLGVDLWVDRDEDADMCIQKTLRNAMAIVDKKSEDAMWSGWAQRHRGCCYY